MKIFRDKINKYLLCILFCFADLNLIFLILNCPEDNIGQGASELKSYLFQSMKLNRAVCGELISGLRVLNSSSFFQFTTASPSSVRIPEVLGPLSGALWCPPKCKTVPQKVRALAFHYILTANLC